MLAVIRHAAIGLVSAFSLCSCGTSLPTMDLRHVSDEEFGTFVSNIAKHVRCELGRAVDIEYDRKYNRHVAQLKNWAAKIALTIRSVDRGAASPGISWNNAAATLGSVAGLRLEADATREMVMTYYLTFAELIDEPENEFERDNRPNELKSDYYLSKCPKNRKTNTVERRGDYETDPIAGDLGIHLTLQSAVETWSPMYDLSTRIKDGPFDTITHHVIFQVETVATANPTLKLINVSVGSNGNLLSGTRTHVDEITITMGPTELGSRKILPSTALNQEFFINRINSRLGLGDRRF